MTRLAPLALLLSAACSGPTPGATDTGEDPGLELEGEVFELLVAGLRTPESDGLADVLKLFFTRPVLLQTHSVTDTSFEVRLALGEIGSDPPVQDACVATTDLPTVQLDGTALTVGPQTSQLEMPDGNLYELQDLYLSGEVSGGGDRLDELVLEGTFDVRQATGFGSFGDADGLCETFGNLGATCAPCDSDGAPYCVSLLAEGMLANKVDVAVEEIAAPDPVACPTTTTR